MPVDQTLEAFEKQIKADIPLAAGLAFRFENFSGDTLSLIAPYKENKNDKLTVFAGSQASLALLSGWSLATLRFKSRGVETVAAVKSDIHFKKPISGDFRVRARFSDSDALADCERSLERKSRGRVDIDVELSEQDDDAVKAVFHGSYFLSK